MSLEDLGNIGEFVAAVAVVVSLIYLAVQIRQNTRALRSTTHQAWASAAAEINMLFPQNRDFARVYRTGSQNPGELDAEELTQFNAYMIQALTVFESLFFQFRDGTIDEVFWNSRLRNLRLVLATPGVRSCWDRYNKDFFDPRFREFVTHEVLGGPAT